MKRSVYIHILAGVQCEGGALIVHRSAEERRGNKAGAIGTQLRHEDVSVQSVQSGLKRSGGNGEVGRASFACHHGQAGLGDANGGGHIALRIHRGMSNSPGWRP